MENFKKWVSEGIRDEFSIEGDAQEIINVFLVGADRAEETGREGEWLRMVSSWVISQTREVAGAINEKFPQSLESTVLQMMVKNAIKYAKFVKAHFVNTDGTAEGPKHILRALNSPLRSAEKMLQRNDAGDLAVRVARIRKVIRGLSGKFNTMFNGSVYGINMRLVEKLKEMNRNFIQMFKRYNEFPAQTMMRNLNLLLQELMPVLEMYLSQAHGFLQLENPQHLLESFRRMVNADEIEVYRLANEILNSNKQLWHSNAKMKGLLYVGLIVSQIKRGLNRYVN